MGKDDSRRKWCALSKPGDDTEKIGVRGWARGAFDGSGSGNGNHIGLVGQADSDGSGSNIGVSGILAGNGTGIQIAVRGEANLNTATDFNYGVFGFNLNANALANYSTGIYGTAQDNPNDNYAIDGTSNSTVGDSYGTTGWAFGSNTNYAIYGQASGGATNYAGYFEGDVFYTGTLSGPPDKKLKKDIKRISSTRKLFTSLPVYSYKFKNIEGMNLPKGKQYGFLAQELEDIFPSLVKQEVVPKYKLHTEILSDGTPVSRKEKIGEEYIKSVNYTGLIPLLTKTIQEQEEALQDQEEKILSLEERIEALESLLK